MKKFKNIRSFILGVIVAALVFTLAIPVLAGSPTWDQIRVAFGGVDIYKDGKLQHPTDANGNPVEVINYEGTNYLPVRAVSKMFNTTINWDGSTRTVFIGEKPDLGTTGVLGVDMPVFNGNHTVLSTKTINDAGTEVLLCNSLACSSVGSSGLSNIITWKLDGYYQYIDGKFIVTTPRLEKTGDCTLEFYSVTKAGEETLIDSYTANNEDGVVDVHVDVMGCSFVRVKSVYKGSPNLYLYDITGTKFN